MLHNSDSNLPKHNTDSKVRHQKIIKLIHKILQIRAQTILIKTTPLFDVYSKQSHKAPYKYNKIEYNRR